MSDYSMKRHLITLIIVMMLILIGTLFTEHLVKRESHQIERYSVLNQLSTVRARLEGAINGNLMLIRGLIAQLALNPDISQKEYAEIAREIMRQKTELRNIASAPNLVISLMYPIEGNEAAIGLDYRNHPEQRDAAMKVVESGEMLVAGPVDLVQGGQGFIARAPVFSVLPEGATGERPLWGLVSAVIDVDALYRSAGLLAPNQPLEIAIRGKDSRGPQGDIFYGDKELFSGETVTMEVKLPNGSWQIAAVPKGGWTTTSTTVWLVRTTGLLIALLTMLLLSVRTRHQRDKREAETSIRFRANFDALTRLPNRAHFLEILDATIGRYNRDVTRLAMLFIDLDQFKYVNDMLGHSLGDQLLVEAAGRIKQCVRRTDTVARLGGDEFTVILLNIEDNLRASIKAEQILELLARPYLLHDHEIHSGASIGITIFPDDGADGAKLLKNADMAMYQAKERGRNTYHYFTQEMTRQAEHFARVEKELRQAMGRDEFILHYQPVLELQSRRIVGAEALVRWMHPERGLVMPGYFIPVAEKTEMIVSIGESILRKACGEMAGWRKNGDVVPVHLAVNVSSRQFRGGFNNRIVAGILDETDFPANDLVFEITESLLLEDDDQILKTLHDIRAASIGLSIDDFGTGYSSLSYLRRFPVNTLKIDRSFINDLEQDENDVRLVEAIISMAQNLQLKVVAEGVETEAQSSILQQMGCDMVQGYLYGKPMPGDEFLARISLQETPPVSEA